METTGDVAPRLCDCPPSYEEHVQLISCSSAQIASPAACEAEPQHCYSPVTPPLLRDEAGSPLTSTSTLNEDEAALFPSSGRIQNDSNAGPSNSSNPAEEPRLVMQQTSCSASCFQHSGLESSATPTGTPLPLCAEYLQLAIMLYLLERFYHKGLASTSKPLKAPLFKSVVETIESLKMERSELLQQIERLECEVDELRRRRAEDGRANERVVSIFASREQAWKAEKRTFRNEQMRLWQELQRTFMEKEALRRKAERIICMEGEVMCEDCDRRERLLLEMRERLGEQEFLIMATMEEAKAEQQEKCALSEKLSAMENLLVEQQEKLASESEGRSEDLRKHEAAITELEARLESRESENAKCVQELKSVQDSLAALTGEKKYFEDLTAQLSTEIDRLHKVYTEKEEIISGMLKKASADTDELHELERELAVIKARLIHTESEKEKWKRLVEGKARSFSRKEGLKPRTSFGSRTDSGFDVIAELQKLHDVEIQNLQSAFEEQVKLLQKRVNLYQERVADLEERMLIRMADTRRMISLDIHHNKSPYSELFDNRGMVVLKESMDAEIATKQFQLSVAKALLKQYVESDAHREQEVEKWKNLYFASKATINILHKDKEHPGSTSKNPRLRDWLEMEKARYASKLEQRHWQEIDAFERQMKARDERMEAFRWQLLSMEDEAQKRLHEIDALNKSLAEVKNENLRLEQELQLKDKELLTLKEELAACNCNHVTSEMCAVEMNRLRDEVLALQDVLTEKEEEYTLSLAKLSSEAECEIQDRECKLAALEAQLVQAYISFEREKRERERVSALLRTEKPALEKFQKRNTHSTEPGMRQAGQKVCQLIETLSCEVTEVHAHAHALLGEMVDEEHVKELVAKEGPSSNYDLKSVGFEQSISKAPPLVGPEECVAEVDEVIPALSAEPVVPVPGNCICDESPVDKFVATVQGGFGPQLLQVP